MNAKEFPMKGLLCLQSWAGYTEQHITILRETPKKYYFRHEDSAFRWKIGSEEYAPKHSIKTIKE